MALKKEEKIGVFLAVVLAFAFLGLSFVFFGDSAGLENPLPDDLLGGADSSDVPEVEGLEVTVLQQGTGEGAETGDTVTVHYVGALEDGTIFDTSVNGEPFELTLGAGGVIQGWDLGLVGMKVGEVRRLEIAPELGYGNQQVGPISPNSTLVFEVELLEIGE